MPRRLLPALAVVLALGIGSTGCADDVSPAARIRDVTITHDELMDEVEEWTRSPRLVEILLGVPATPAAGRFDMDLVGLVLSNRIAFDIYGAEFDARSLEVDPALLDQVRAGIFQDPADSAAVMEQLAPAFADRLVEDIARQFMVQSELSDELPAFEAEAFADIEVSPRYGRWDPASRTVVPPDGPLPAPADDLVPEP